VPTQSKKTCRCTGRIGIESNSAHKKKSAMPIQHEHILMPSLFNSVHERTQNAPGTFFRTTQCQAIRKNRHIWPAEETPILPYKASTGKFVIYIIYILLPDINKPETCRCTRPTNKAKGNARFLSQCRVQGHVSGLFMSGSKIYIIYIIKNEFY